MWPLEPWLKTLGDLNRKRDRLSKFLCSSRYPTYNIRKGDANECLLCIALPGFKVNDLTVIYQDNVLTVSGTPSRTSDGILHQGFPIEKFEKSWPLIDALTIGREARLRNGILEIIILCVATGPADSEDTSPTPKRSIIVV